MSEKPAEVSPREGDELYRLIVESAREYAIFTTDDEGRIATWSAGAERILGYKEAEVLGQDARIIFTPEDRERGVPEQEMRTALETGRGEDMRWHVRKGGSRFWADGDMMPLKDEQGRARGFVKIVRDRTAEKRAETRYRESEERFRLMVESATDYVIFTTDLENRVTTWNTGAERLLGYAEAEILGQDARIIFTPEDREQGKPEQEREKALAEGRAENERWHVRKDGSRFWGSGLMMTLKDGLEGAPGFIKIFRDMTERRQIEAEQERLLKEVVAERERLGEVFRTSPAFLAVLRGPEHTFELVNERYSQLVGHRDMIGKPVREAIPEVEGQGFFELLDRVYQSGEPFIGNGMRILLESQPGRLLEERFVDFVYQPIREPTGEVSGILAHGIDLTERKRAEEQLRASEERYRSLFTSIDEGFCVIEMIFDAGGRPSDYRFLEMNPAFEKHTGLHNAAGRTAREVVPGLDAHWFETYGTVALTGEPVRFVSEAKALDDRWFDVYAFRLGEPERRRVAILFNDISASKRAEIERERLVEQLQEADRRKDEFLAMLAHELRNPLAAIHGAVRVVNSPRMVEHIPEALEIIERQTRNLTRLIDDLLDVSRITQGKIELKREVLDVPGIIDRAARAVRPLIEQKRHELAVRVAPGPLRVDADPTRFEQVLVNLLTNAAKYTEDGGRITVSAAREGTEAVIKVRDTGVGIAPEMLPRVFDLFTQVDRSLARSEGGLGIGLTLVKRLVEIHGGTITAASEIGRGSEFTISLPVHEATLEEQRPERGQVVSGRGKRVLIVDDNADTARLTGRLLRSFGFDVQVTHDGRAAVEAARDHRPEAVLLDIGLPGMSGYEVARQLRREECCSQSLIIAVSGYGDSPSRERGRDAGFNHHLAKPVDIDAILDLLGREARPGT